MNIFYTVYLNLTLKTASSKTQTQKKDKWKPSRS